VIESTTDTVAIELSGPAMTSMDSDDLKICPVTYRGPARHDGRVEVTRCTGNPYKQNRMNRALVNHYRCPENLVEFRLTGQLSVDPGYFLFGHTRIYGCSTSGSRAGRADAVLYDAMEDVTNDGSAVCLPFSPSDVIDNLRLERYADHHGHRAMSLWKRSLRSAYYFVRPLMPVSVRRHVQRAHLEGWQNISFPRWPVDTTVENLCEQLLILSMRAKGIARMPFVWFWPHGAQSCVAMTHDVETKSGRDFCAELMDIDDYFGIKASVHLVPEGRYEVDAPFIQRIRDRGFEVNIQDLNHDGHLFNEREEFLRRAKKINRYGIAYKAKGFRSAVLYRNLDWYDALEFSFDTSVPNVAHLDPQRGGCCTVMPYFIGNMLEIPVTTTQDYMLFHLLNDYSLDLWKTQTQLIAEKNGLVSFIVHPDYVIEAKAQGVYRDLLTFLRQFGLEKRIWFAVSGEIDHWCRARSRMRVVGHDGEWRIEGIGAEHAKLAFARLVDDRLEYELGA
jgi:hypothetical protein